MNGPNPQKPPAAVLAMNVVGSVFFMVGIAKAVGLDMPMDDFLPKGYHIVLIAAGVLLDIPFIKFHVDQARQRKDRQGSGGA
jgi:hypothetical protein